MPGDRQGVGPGDDEEVPTGPGLDRGANLLHVLLALDHPLAPHVPALLRPHLVFEEAAGRPGGDQLVDRAEDVQRIAVAGVGVDDDRESRTLMQIRLARSIISVCVSRPISGSPRAVAATE